MSKQENKSLFHFSQEFPELFKDVETMKKNFPSGYEFSVFRNPTNSANVIKGDIVSIRPESSFSIQGKLFTGLSITSLGGEQSNNVSWGDLKPVDISLFLPNKSKLKKRILSMKKDRNDLVERIKLEEEKIKYLDISGSDVLNENIFKAYYVLKVASGKEEIDKKKIDEIAKLL